MGVNENTTSFEGDVLERVNIYLEDVETSSGLLSMLVDLTIEEFKRVRNYPSSYTEEQIVNDMKKHLNTIAIAVVEVFNKQGAEGQTSHGENGISRTYENAFISNSLFRNVVPFANLR